MATVTTAKHGSPGLKERFARFLATAKRTVVPPRRMTTAERREIQRRVAEDPEVDRALRELLAERPDLRMKGSATRGIQGRSE